jgi:hypothetical protein
MRLTPLGGISLVGFIIIFILEEFWLLIVHFVAQQIPTSSNF